MHRSIALGLAFLAAGCSSAALTDAGAPDAAGGPAPGIYVLTSMGSSTTAPFVTLDLRCGPDRVHRQFLTVGDTITINADGSAREAQVTATLENDVQTDSRHLVMDGSWASFNSTGYGFFGGYPSINVSVIIPIQTGGLASVTNGYRVEADGSLSRPDGTGGSCDGDQQPLERFTSTYKRI